MQIHYYGMREHGKHPTQQMIDYVADKNHRQYTLSQNSTPNLARCSFDKME